MNQYRSFLVIDGIEVLLDGREWKDAGYFHFFSSWQEQGKNSVILITSQEIPTIHREASWHPLQGLSQKAGSKLLGLKLRLNATEFQSKQVELESISQSIDGHPLTLRLVASYLSSYCGDGADFCNSNILERAKEAGLLEFPALLENASGVHRGEQTCLDRVLKRHLECLTHEQLLTLTALSVYRLPFTLDAAAEIINNPTPLETLKLLLILVQRSLLTKEQGHYSIQPSIRKYIQSRGDLQVDSHCKAIAYYQKNLTPEPWSDIADIGYHMELFYHQFEIKDYFRAFDTAESVADFIDLKGYILSLSEMYGNLNRNWERNSTNQKELCTIWNRLGNIFTHLGLIESSFGLYQQALRLAREIGEKYGEAVALKGLGDYYSRPGSFGEAIPYYQISLEIAQEIGDRNLEVNSLSGLGRVYFERGQYNESIYVYERALKRHRSGTIQTKREQKTELYIIISLGVAYKWQHEYKQATKVHSQLLSIATHYKSKKYEYDALFGLGFIEYCKKEYPISIDFYSRALEIARNIGSRRQEAVVLCDLGRIMEACERYSEALQYNEQALEILERIGDRSYIAKTLKYRANIYRARKNYDEAIKLYHQASDIARDSNEVRDLLLILLDWGIAYYYMNQFEESKTVYEEAIQIARRTEYKREEALAYFFKTISLVKSGDSFSALKYNESAKILFQQMGIQDLAEDCKLVIQGYNDKGVLLMAPSIEKTTICLNKLSEIEENKIKLKVKNRSSTELQISSDLLQSLALAFYSIVLLFIVANLLQGHYIVSFIILLITVIPGLLRIFRKN